MISKKSNQQKYFQNKRSDIRKAIDYQINKAGNVIPRISIPNKEVILLFNGIKNNQKCLFGISKLSKYDLNESYILDEFDPLKKLRKIKINSISLNDTSIKRLSLLMFAVYCKRDNIVYSLVKAGAYPSYYYSISDSNVLSIETNISNNSNYDDISNSNGNVVITSDVNIDIDNINNVQEISSNIENHVNIDEYDIRKHLMKLPPFFSVYIINEIYNMKLSLYINNNDINNDESINEKNKCMVCLKKSEIAPQYRPLLHIKPCNCTCCDRCIWNNVANIDDNDFKCPFCNIPVDIFNILDSNKHIFDTTTPFDYKILNERKKGNLYLYMYNRFIYFNF
jgi:hypothetical protein